MIHFQMWPWPYPHVRNSWIGKKNKLNGCSGRYRHLWAADYALLSIKVLIDHVKRAGVALPWMESWSSYATMESTSQLSVFLRGGYCRLKLYIVR